MATRRNLDKRDLPSLFYASPPTVLSFTVGAAGAVNRAPGRFAAARGEVVTWAVTNASGKAITVRLETFLRKKTIFDSHGDPHDGVDDFFVWIPSNTLKLGGTNPNSGYLYARIAKKPKHALGDFLSYTIRVADDGGSFDIYYDPDGDIKP